MLPHAARGCVHGQMLVYEQGWSAVACHRYGEEGGALEEK